MPDYQRARHTSVRIPIGLDDELRERAAEQDRPIHRQILRYLREGVARDRQPEAGRSDTEEAP